MKWGLLILLYNAVLFVPLVGCGRADQPLAANAAQPVPIEASAPAKDLAKIIAAKARRNTK